MTHSRRKKPATRAAIARARKRSQRTALQGVRAPAKFPAPSTPEQVAALIREMKIREHLNAIVAAREALPLMGDKWVRGVVAYREQCLERLGYKP